ncbi:hypothetical protein DPMN_076561 [Dreissena polymorpha]|uniref:Uncharacterized protein n=1 Tax=Dreissena polymorpha TaxID=45954 RepID=A0A9D3YMG5_DREPO|nr:hypothetical protein DPMN_076561 [Dreissena polymorpha]
MIGENMGLREKTVPTSGGNDFQRTTESGFESGFDIIRANVLRKCNLKSDLPHYLSTRSHGCGLEYAYFDNSWDIRVLGIPVHGSCPLRPRCRHFRRSGWVETDFPKETPACWYGGHQPNAHSSGNGAHLSVNGD